MAHIGEIEKAISVAEKIEDLPTRDLAWRQVGEILAGRKDVNKAIEVLERINDPLQKIFGYEKASKTYFQAVMMDQIAILASNAEIAAS